MKRLSACVCAVLMLAAAGCGLKPRGALPPGLDAEDALLAVRRHGERIIDFKGTASVAATNSAGQEYSTTLTLRYLRPDLYRVSFRGFAGMQLAVATAIGDSMTIYVPSENAYVRLHRDEAPAALSLLVPDIRIDLDRLTGVFTGLLPPPEATGRYTTRLEKRDGRAILYLAGQGREYRYTLEGRDLLVVDERITEGGRTVWHREASSFVRSNDVLFPSHLIVGDGGRTVEMDFRSLTVNSGLAFSDIEFAVPSSAERMYIGI